MSVNFYNAGGRGENAKQGHVAAAEAKFESYRIKVGTAAKGNANCKIT